MREIKFRILRKDDCDISWNIIYTDDFIDDELYLSSRYYDKKTLTQFTGLHDKNGKEIYEGDILGGLYGCGYISWCEKCKQFQYFGCKDECFACGGDVHWFELLVEEELEVIGNIFENPELIN